MTYILNLISLPTGTHFERLDLFVGLKSTEMVSMLINQFEFFLFFFWLIIVKTRGEFLVSNYSLSNC